MSEIVQALLNIFAVVSGVWVSHFLARKKMNAEIEKINLEAEILRRKIHQMSPKGMEKSGSHEVELRGLPNKEILASEEIENRTTLIKEQKQLFSKVIPFKKIAYNGIVAGFVAVILLFMLGGGWWGVLIPPFIGGIIASYMLIKLIPGVSKSLAIKVSIMGGAISSIPLTLVFIVFPSNSAEIDILAFIGIIEAFIGLIGSWVASIYLLRQK